MTRTLAALVATFVVAWLPAAAQAKTFNVDSTADTADAANDGECATAANVCTIRAAIQQANQLSGVDGVVIPGGTYNLGSTLPISTTINIEGPDGARATVLDGTPSQRVIGVTGGGTMSYSGITLTGGRGGLEISNADVTLDRVTIRGNTVSSGGLNEGGGVLAGTNSSLTITRSTVSGNTVVSTSMQALGGGISMGANTTLAVANSTIAGNRSEAFQTPYGGGISLRQGTTTVLRHVTVVGNVTAGNSIGAGGNIYRNPTSTLLTIEDSIIADGNANGGNTPNCATSSPIFVAGRNLDSGTSCGFPAGHLNNTPAQLVMLGDHGGPTQTRPPMPTSPVRDAAGACEPDGTDQRGAAVPAGAACDIGSTELGSDLVTTLTASSASAAQGENITFVARVTNGGVDAAPTTVLDFGLPAGAEIVTVEPSAGTCNGTHCDLGAIANEASATVTLVMRAPSSSAFATSAAASSGYPDPDPANNSATINTNDGATDPGEGDPPPSDGEPPPSGNPPPPGSGPGACANPILGTRLDNTLRGTAAGDLIRGRAGDDKLVGRRGDDCLFGNGGKDTLKAGGGKDRLSGGRGRDKLNGGGRKDAFRAGAGDDRVNSVDGRRETVKCGKGNDKVKADRADRLVGCEVVRRV